jgi:pSer/pThr/pTyr-binding forkhead associated (FHA) protein
MKLRIESPDGGSQIVELDDKTASGEMTIGRNASTAKIAINDPSISRLHASLWIENGDIWLADENSTNGTYVNGERIFKPVKIRKTDEIRLGLGTRIFLEDNFATPTEEGYFEKNTKNKAEQHSTKNSAIQTKSTVQKSERQESDSMLKILLLALASASFIIFCALIAFFIAKRFEEENTQTKRQKSSETTVRRGVLIPVRVIDPLGGENPEDLDDLIASWEVEEKEIRAEDLSEITISESEELKVSVDFWRRQKELAYAPRNGATGIVPPGLQVPPELFGDGVIKQKTKLAEMLRLGYKQPMDFADLAEKRLKRELIELPIATESYFLDVGGSATNEPFTAFDFDSGGVPIMPGSRKYEILSQLASNFDGQKYDLNNPEHRKQMRIRLLRMLHPNAKPVLKEIADAYFKKFGRPLRVTSLTRSMDYQILLNRTNPNSFKVSGAGSLPPHTSGCAFDLARKHMTAEEQNFLMQKLAEMERRGIIDALIEYNQNACFHIFVYPDGKP